MCSFLSLSTNYPEGETQCSGIGNFGADFGTKSYLSPVFIAHTKNEHVATIMNNSLKSLLGTNVAPIRSDRTCVLFQLPVFSMGASYAWLDWSFILSL